MKDEDNKTNALCYCKENLPSPQLGTKDEEKTIITGKQLKKTQGEKEELWSMFGKWYWI